MDKKARRLYLSFALKLLIFMGVILVSIPFIASLDSGTDTETTSSAAGTRIIDVSALTAGAYLQTRGPGGEVWVYRRTPDEMKSLTRQTSLLRDAESLQSQQAENCRNPYRSLDKAYFVFLPYESQRGCLVHLSDDGGFTEPCYGAHFDTAGRIYKQGGHLAQTNLVVPVYEMLGEGKIRVLMQPQANQR